MGERCRMLTPSLRVIDSRIQKSGFFHRLVLFSLFSIVFQNNCGGDSQSLFKPVSFLVRRPVAISVATTGDSIGDYRESSHLIRYANLMWFFLMFSFPLLLFVYSSLHMCLYIFSFWVNCVWINFAYVDRYFGIALFAWEVSGYSAGGVWVCIILPSHTHCAYHEWDPILGFV